MLSPAVLFSLPCAVSNLLCSILQPPHPPPVLSSPDSFSILPVLLFKLTAHLPPLDHLLPSIFSLFSVPEIRPAPDHCRGNLRCIVNTFRVHCRESSRQSSCQCGNDYPSTTWKLPPTLIYLKSPKPVTAWQAGQVDNCGLFSLMLNGTRKPDTDSHYWNNL